MICSALLNARLINIHRISNANYVNIPVWNALAMLIVQAVLFSLFFMREGAGSNVLRVTIKSIVHARNASNCVSTVLRVHA